MRKLACTLVILSLGTGSPAGVASADDGGVPAAVVVEDDGAAAKLQGTIVSGVVAALDQDAKKATRELSQAGLMGPDHPELQELLGLAALVVGDRSRATRLLSGNRGLATFHAMALADGPGGIGRAREVLADHAKLPDAEADASALFLAALAFSAAGDEVRAHELLDRAVKLAPSALDEAFAPDPAVALVERSVKLLAKLGAPKSAALTLAKKLQEKGRRHAVARLAKELATDTSVAAAAERLVAAVYEKSDPRRALDVVEGLLRAGKRDGVDLAEVALKKAELQLVLGDVDGARRTASGLDGLDAAARARAERLRAKLQLEKGGDPRLALEAAESAASLEPRSNVALGLLARALLANGQLDRASAFASTLLDRKPKDVDPFAILAAIAEARQETTKVRTLRLRSEAFASDRARLDAEVRRRESVLRAVREAEGGLGIAGLTAVRGEEPAFALPADLAMAKSATAGFKRQARERILSACQGDLAKLLGRTTGWEKLDATLSPYGKVETTVLALSAADPARCSGRASATRAPKRR
ncbi:tetratricopeptide repeat protein [Myxococcota bacterium]|nr:tetratricopeptide repeat protein [Myxococcota bacterium]